MPGKIKVGLGYAGNRQHHLTTSLRSATLDFQNDDGRASYQALEIDWRRAFANGLELIGNYTRSKTRGDTASSVTQFQRPYRYAYADWHEPHALNMMALVRSKGFLITPKFNYHSGRPYSINSPAVGTAVQYVDFKGNPTGRNIYAMPANSNFDLTIQREFSFESLRLSPTVILNLTNKVNIYKVSTVLANAGQPTNVGAGRQVQFGVGINFGR